MKKNVLSYVLMALALAVGVIGWIVWPDVVTVQVGFDGHVTNTMPKAAAVLVPTIVSWIGSVINLASKKKADIKGIVLAIVGIAVMGLMFLFN